MVSARDYFKNDTGLNESDLSKFDLAGIFGFAKKYAKYVSNQETKQLKEQNQKLKLALKDVVEVFKIYSNIRGNSQTALQSIAAAQDILKDLEPTKENDEG